MISKTLLSEALSRLYREKEQFSLRGRRHKGKLNNNMRRYRKSVVQQGTPVCSAPKCEDQERPPLPPHWRGTGHISPWQNCQQPLLYKQRGWEKVPRCFLRGGRLINPTVLSLLEAAVGLKEANGSSILSVGFVPRAAWGWHVIPVTLPPHQGPSLLLNPGG